MRSIMASRRQHPSYSPDTLAGQYEIPEPISHVRILTEAESEGRVEIANVVDLDAARARLRPAS
jgi:hypothetical protein